MARIWDRFLTERDREHLAKVPPKQRVGFGERPALILIDNYRNALGYARQDLLDLVQDFPFGTDGWEAVDRSRELLVQCREVSMPIVHITALDPNVTGVPMWIDWLHHNNPDYAEGVFDIVDELAPLPGEIVLRKNAPSAFWGTPLAGILRGLGVDTLLVCGEATSGCVRATVVEAASHRYRVQVVEECVYDRHEATHAMNLFDMHEKYADVIPLTDALSYVDGLRDTAASRSPAALGR